jgi:hypothetical protein
MFSIESSQFFLVNFLIECTHTDNLNISVSAFYFYLKDFELIIFLTYTPKPKMIIPSKGVGSETS